MQTTTFKISAWEIKRTSMKNRTSQWPFDAVLLAGLTGGLCPPWAGTEAYECPA